MNKHQKAFTRTIIIEISPGSIVQAVVGGKKFPLAIRQDQSAHFKNAISADPQLADLGYIGKHPLNPLSANDLDRCRPSELARHERVLLLADSNGLTDYCDALALDDAAQRKIDVMVYPDREGQLSLLINGHSFEARISPEGFAAITAMPNHAYQLTDYFGDLAKAYKRRK